MITPFIPTAEEIAERERLRARSPLPTVAQGTTHTQSTGVPAAAPQACAGSALAQPARSSAELPSTMARSVTLMRSRSAMSACWAV